MAKITVTRPISDNGLQLLRNAGHEVIVHNEDWVMSLDQLQEFVAGSDIILCSLTEQMNGDVMDAAGPQLKHIATYNVGYDNIDLAAASARNLVVTNTAGSISSVAVAEHVVALTLGVARNLRSADFFMRGGHYKFWGPNLLTGTQLHGRTFGIAGSGQIGTIAAHIMHNGFGMEVLYTDVAENAGFEIIENAEKVTLDELLERSDVVSLHVPLLPSTRHMIGAAQFEKMKNTAILINTSRGPVIDENALVVALRNKSIAGAGIDVFEFEPEMAAGLAELDNVLLTPHIASATEPTRLEMSECVAQNILAVLEGKPGLNPVKMPAKA